MLTRDFAAGCPLSGDWSQDKGHGTDKCSGQPDANFVPGEEIKLPGWVEAKESVRDMYNTLLQSVDLQFCPDEVLLQMHLHC